MQVNRKAANGMVRRLTCGIGEASIALWAAPARRLPTGLTSAERSFALVSVGSARYLIGFNLVRLPQRRVGQAQAWECVHIKTLVLCTVRRSFCGVSGPYSCFFCFMCGGNLCGPSLLHCGHLVSSCTCP